MADESPSSRTPSRAQRRQTPSNPALPCPQSCSPGSRHLEGGNTCRAGVASSLSFCPNGKRRSPLRAQLESWLWLLSELGGVHGHSGTSHLMRAQLGRLRTRQFCMRERPSDTSSVRLARSNTHPGENRQDPKTGPENRPAESPHKTNASTRTRRAATRAPAPHKHKRGREGTDANPTHTHTDEHTKAPENASPEQEEKTKDP